MTDPPLTLACDVKARLQAAHIFVAGHAVTDRLLQEEQKPVPVATSNLCSYPSEELLQMVETMLHHSDNLYAEAMLRYVALSQDTVATVSTALAIERDIWKKPGSTLRLCNSTTVVVWLARMLLLPIFGIALITGIPYAPVGSRVCLGLS